MHLLGYKSKLKLPFILYIYFDDPSNTGHENSGGFEMEAIVIPKQFDLILIFVVLVKSLQILFAFSVLHVILKLNPSAAVVALYQVIDLWCAVFIIFGQSTYDDWGDGKGGFEFF